MSLIWFALSSCLRILAIWLFLVFSLLLSLSLPLSLPSAFLPLSVDLLVCLFVCLSRFACLGLYLFVCLFLYLMVSFSPSACLSFCYMFSVYISLFSYSWQQVSSLFLLPPARFWKRREILFWGPSPSPRMFCFISRLLLKVAFWNLACAIYAKTIFLKCF